MRCFPWTTANGSNEKRLFAVFAFCSVGSSLLLCFIGPIGWRYRIELEGFVLMAAAFALCRNNAGAAAVPRQSSLQG
jgi:hypothetical protein